LEQPIAAIATAPPETNLNPEQPQASNGQDQSSAARREPKSIRNVRRHYGDRLPPWRHGWGIGEYTLEMLNSAAQYIAALPPTSALAHYVPIQLLEEYEEKERWANLESRAKALNPTAVSGSVSHVPQDQSDTIAQIETYLQILGWSKRDAIEHLIELGKLSPAIRQIAYEGTYCNFERLNNLELTMVCEATMAQIKARNAPQSESDDGSYKRSG
jgi:hypothetical protein